MYEASIWHTFAALNVLNYDAPSNNIQAYRYTYISTLVWSSFFKALNLFATMPGICVITRETSPGKIILKSASFYPVLKDLFVECFVEVYIS